MIDRKEKGRNEGRKEGRQKGREEGRRERGREEGKRVFLPLISLTITILLKYRIWFFSLLENVSTDKHKSQDFKDKPNKETCPRNRSVNLQPIYLKWGKSPLHRSPVYRKARMKKFKSEKALGDPYVLYSETWKVNKISTGM